MQDGLLLGCNRAAALGSWSPSRWGHTFDGQTTPKPELNSSVALSGAIGLLRDGDLHRHGRAAHLSHGPDVSVCLEVCSAPRACFELLFSAFRKSLRTFYMCCTMCDVEVICGSLLSRSALPLHASKA